MSKYIYTSSKVSPYIYMGTHRETQQFYIGYRAANKKSSSEDLGIKYFTSSKSVKELGFDNFNWVILAEFFEKSDAMAAEQELISEHISNPKCLNKFVNGKFSMLGKSMSLETIEKIKKLHTGKKRSAETCQKMSLAQKGREITPEARKKLSENHGTKNPETRRKISEACTGYRHTEEAKAKISKNSGSRRPEVKAKISLIHKGRKHTEEAKLKMRRPKPKIKCLHCQGEFNAGNLARYHGDKCKQKAK